MLKFMENYKTNKKCFIIYLFILLFCIIISICYFLDETVPTNFDIKNNIITMKSNTIPLGEITKETEVIQTFTVEESRFDYANLLIATYTNIITSDYKFELFNNTLNETVESWEISGNRLLDNSIIELRLKNTLENISGHEFSIIVTSENAMPGNAITLWAFKKTETDTGNLYINGKLTELYSCINIGNIDYSKFNFFCILPIIFLFIVFIAFISTINSIKENIVIKNHLIILTTFSIFVVISAILYLLNIYLPGKNDLEVNDGFYYLMLLYGTGLLLTSLGIKYNISQLIVYKIKILFKDKKNILLKSILFFAVLLLSFTLCNIYCFLINIPYDKHILIFSLLTGIIIYCIYIFRKKPEQLFLFISVSIGFLIVITFYQIGEISWDEQIHLNWALEKSFVNFGRTSTSLDNAVIYQYSKIAHFPSGIIFYFSRLTNVSNTVSLIFGKCANVITYSVIIYFAIKRLKSGKYILSVIALIPTCLFLASNYSYDYWVIAWIILGFSYFFSEIQQPDKVITLKSSVIMIGSFVIGLGPKAVYFPLMFTLYFIGKSKFKNISAYKKYMWAVTASGVFVVISFLLPFVLSGGGGEGDLRGGNDVNSSAQTMFILQNPIQYADILFNFLTSYLSVESMRDYTVFFAYLGHISNFTLLIILVVIVCVTDKSDYDIITSKIKYKLLMGLLALITSTLIASALYISFTPVALNTINGCQPRYILPLVFPVLFVIGSGKIKNHINKSVYTICVFGVSSYILLSGIWDLCISKYN